LYDATHTSDKLAQTIIFPPYARDVPILIHVLLRDYYGKSRGSQAHFSTAPPLSPTIVIYVFSTYLLLC